MVSLSTILSPSTEQTVEQQPSSQEGHGTKRKHDASTSSDSAAEDTSQKVMRIAEICEKPQGIPGRLRGDRVYRLNKKWEAKPQELVHTMPFSKAFHDYLSNKYHLTPQLCVLFTSNKIEEFISIEQKGFMWALSANTNTFAYLVPPY